MELENVKIQILLLTLLSVIQQAFAKNIDIPIPERVVGGKDIPADQYVPYQVSLQYLVKNKDNNKASYRHYCGGSIISANHILTAAHCCHGFDPSRMSIVAGVRDLTEGGVRRTIDNYEIHPDFIELTTSDIAVLKLSTPLELNNSTIAAVDVISRKRVPAGIDVTLTGWGLRLPLPIEIPFIGQFFQEYIDAYNYPTVLQTLTYRTVSDTQCKRVISDLTETEVCGQGSSVSGACSGDSGGPLVQKTSNGWRQVGIVSYGLFVCGVFNSVVPDVYTRVSVFSEWLETQMLSL